ncbi:MAG: iron-containing alcohol dehydrogenase [Bacillus subtilis]|nr:iron-containing alcohol dehydrogenase [Bacillus subtilis]
MSLFLPIYARTVQAALRVATLIIRTPEPTLLEGPGSITKVPELLRMNNVKDVLIVTDRGVLNAGLLSGLLEQLETQAIRAVIYAETTPNPTIEQIEAARELYLREQLGGAVAVGGGSPIDLAKAVLARVARPRKSIRRMKGILKVGKKLPLLIAVPTTAGTGSEATLAAVVANPKTLEKYAINDPHLVPAYAVLDPTLTMKLPKALTASTGIDALTHAVEAFIGRANTKQTKAAAMEAVRLIFKHLGPCVLEESNLESRAKMQKAAYLAGYAFTRAYVGNVHAVAHTLGGYYGVPHGVANAALLPIVLRYYKDKVDNQLAILSDLAHVCGPRDSNREKSVKFIDAIEAMNLAFGLPRWFDVIQEIDIPAMAKKAFLEANPLYPVPVILEKKDFEAILRLASRKA